jgi:acyl carrier protein
VLKGLEMEGLLDQIGMLLTTRFGVPRDEFRADVVLADLDLDSLALVEFGLVAEKEFGVRVREDEVSPQDTVENLVSLIASKGLSV